MKFTLTICLFLCTVGGLLAQDLRLATFNCEFLIERKVQLKYGLPYDMKYASASDKKKWTKEYRRQQFENSTDKVAEQIKKINADIIGLTEVGNPKEIALLVELLRKKGLEYPFWKVGKSHDTATGQHVAFLSKYELTDVVYDFKDRGIYFTETDFDETDDTGISKGMKVTVTIKETPIHLFLFHLKSERGGEESDKKRLMQAEIARRQIIPYLQQNKHVIVMGDLNSEKRHPVLRTLRGFDDIYSELIQTGDSYYFEKFDTRWTYNYKGQEEQIDHILLSLSFKKWCKNNNPKQNTWGIKTLIEPTAKPVVSDHNALIVELNFH
jgi:predicted extracellular nuclease